MLKMWFFLFYLLIYTLKKMLKHLPNFYILWYP